jgi:hypothetical protein
MQGTVKDDGSSRAGPREYRLTLADGHSKASASILFTASWIENRFSSGIRRTIRAVTARFLRNLGIGGLAVVVSVGLVDKVTADVVPPGHINYRYQSIDIRLAGGLSWQRNYALRGRLNISRGRRDLTGYHLMAYHSSWWAEGNFNEGENIEWIYENLENQYRFLDVTLYKLLGGNYILGPPTDPHWHGFRDYYWEEDSGKGIIVLSEDKVSPEWIDIWGEFYFFGEPAEPDDQLIAYIDNIIVGQHIVSDEGRYNLRIFKDNPLTAYIDGAVPGYLMTFAAWHQGTGKMYPVEILQGVPMWTFHGDSIRVDINTVPEPSSIALFGFVALGVLLFRRKTHRVPDGYV